MLRASSRSSNTRLLIMGYWFLVIKYWFVDYGLLVFDHQLSYYQLLVLANDQLLFTV